MLHVHEFFAKHKDQFSLFLKASLAQFLPSWFRTYYELRSRLQPGEKTVTILPEELASSLGYDVSHLQNVLRDFSLLGLISYKTGTTDSAPSTITIHVL